MGGGGKRRKGNGRREVWSKAKERVLSGPVDLYGSGLYLHHIKCGQAPPTTDGL